MKLNRKHPAQILTEEKQQKRSHLRKQMLWILAALCLILFWFEYIWAVVIVKGSSMYPSVQDLDMVLCNRLFDQVKRGDIIVAKDSYQEVYYVKRVIGLSGNEIDIKDGYVYVDGQKLHESYSLQRTLAHDEVFPIIVPNGSVFVLGDHRTISRDSRDTEIGMVEIQNIVGKAFFVFRKI